MSGSASVTTRRLPARALRRRRSGGGERARGAVCRVRPTARRLRFRRGLPNAWGVTPYLRTIVTLARAVQSRDPYAAGRSERVTRLAQRMAIELGLGAEHSHAIAVGVVCADIGKIGLPDRLLHGRGHLSDEDYATLRSYPAMSSYILGELELPGARQGDGPLAPRALGRRRRPRRARRRRDPDLRPHPLRGRRRRRDLLRRGRRPGRHPLLPDDVAAAERCLAADRALREYIAA